ncbi:MAG: glycosyltransferase family 2 protein [Cryobacterium sp.]|nr:glycosyltransferase family 2 protein [Oligoflexia bacterium]
MNKVSGFTLVRHGSKFDYPYLESLRSLLPIVDELVINVGIGEDETLERIKKFAADEGNGKVVLFESHWPLDDPEKRKGGQILSEQTNLALERCSGEWCVYLQADEVIHESDYPHIREAFQRFQGDNAVDGLLFDYIHFYGSFDVFRHSRSAYRREVRAIKRSSGARSIGDAQSFRLPSGEKPRVAHSGAKIYHYGWVRPPEVMKEKTFFMDSLYHGVAKSGAKEPATGDNYRYKKIWGLYPFRGSHPSVMLARIRTKAWSWNLAESRLEWEFSDAKKILLDTIERFSGKRFFEYRSYRRVR